MRKNYLLTPGPTPLPPEICEAMSRPIIHHRTPQFQEVIKEVHEGLKYIYQTTNEVFMLASSGTGAMEAAVVNLCSPGDTVITVEGGKFGKRWTEIAKANGINCEVIKVEWGKAVSPEEIKSKINPSTALRIDGESFDFAQDGSPKDGEFAEPRSRTIKNPLPADRQEKSKIKAVFVTLCETSTGVANDIKAIGEVLKHTEAALVVDAISGLGAIDLQTDAWHCDVVVSGSQKGLMLPPGLGFISMNPKAWKLAENSKCPKYYFDLKKAKKAYDKVDTPFTPGVTLIIALREALRLIKADGLENVFKRYKKMADATRAAVKALGLELFAPDAASDVVTAAKVPQGIDGEKLVKTMRDTYGVTIAGGQDEMKGKLIRIAHMGYIAEFDIITGISCLEKVLHEMGYKFQLGAGVKAAEEVFNA